ncbi:MAG: hypothetical protein AB1757_17015 [Acidobacteriota bacterium]
MNSLSEEFIEERSLSVVAVVYYLIMLAAFGIGLYGLYNLIWLAGLAAEQHARVVGIG